MTGGYLCCLSNQSMPGILNIGMTEISPEKKLNEANKHNTFIPTPYKFEFAKKVLNPKQKLITLHKLLSQYRKRINPEGEFFRVSTDEVKTFFDLIDGYLWVKDPEEEETEKQAKKKIYKPEKHSEDEETEKQAKKKEYKPEKHSEDEEMVIDLVKKTIDGRSLSFNRTNNDFTSFVYCGKNYIIHGNNTVWSMSTPDKYFMGFYDTKANKINYYETTITNSPFVKCRDNRDMRTYFRHRDDIRHYISSKNDAWDGIYDFSKNAIIYEKKIYKSINEFAVSHYNSFGLAHLENRVDAWS